MGIHFSLAFSFSCPRGNLCEYQIPTGHRTCETHGEQCWVQVDILSGVFRDCIHLAQNHHISNYTWRTRRKGREGYIWCEGYLMSYSWCCIPIFLSHFMSSLWSSKPLLIHPDPSVIYLSMLQYILARTNLHSCEGCQHRLLYVRLLLSLASVNGSCSMGINVELTSRNPVIDIRSMKESASSSILCCCDMSILVLSPADFFNTERIDSRFSVKNLRPCSSVCWCWDPRLNTAAQIILMIAASKS